MLTCKLSFEINSYVEKGKKYAATSLLQTTWNNYADVYTVSNENNVNFTAKYGDGTIPLSQAAENGCANVCSVLLKCIASFNEKH